MKTITITLLVLSSFMMKAQSEVSLYRVAQRSDIIHQINNRSTYRSMDVEISNRSQSSKTIKVECGTVFKNHTTSEQSLVVIFPDEFMVPGSSTRSSSVTTACMDAAKSQPSSSSTWSIEFDAGIGQLIEFYHAFRPMISMLTGPEQHETKSNQIDFLQMAVWTYYKCDKSKIVDFSAKYMFDGDRELAQAYGDVTYPLIQLFIEHYKQVYDK